MKRNFIKLFSVITLIAICMSIVIVPVSAASLGDVDGNGKVVASDARKVLRHSAKLEILPDSLFSIADVNFDNKITASDARMILRVAAKLDQFKEDGDAAIAKIPLADYNGLKANKLPYEAKGLKIESIKYDSAASSMQVVVRNKAGYAVESTSYIKYKCYDASNVFITERYMYVRNMNNNEACLLTFDVHRDTAKVVFYDADVTKCAFVPSYNMQTVDGMQVSKMPLNLNGIYLQSISFEKKYNQAKLIVSNKTGYPISSSSCVSYKTYNADGYIINSRDVYLEEMNNNENAIVDFYYDEGVTKFVFYSSDIRKSESLYQGQMVDIGGLSINKMPYSSNGISLESASYDAKYGYLNVMFKNNNKVAISDLSNMEYKVYNAENFVIKSSNVYTTHLNSQEKCIKTISLPEGATRVVFGKADVREAEALTVKAFSTYDGISMNTLPYNTNGVKIEAASVDKSLMLKIRVRNATGNPITSSTWVNYKCYNSDGVIIRASSFSTYNLNNNEAQYYTTYLPEGTVKVAFLNSSVKTGEAKKTYAVSPFAGMQMNTLPVNINGLNFSSVRKDADYGYLYFTVVNNTGKNLKDSTYVSYCCYDADGIIVKDGSTYTPRMNMGTQAEIRIIPADTAVKTVIYNTKVVPATE